MEDSQTGPRRRVERRAFRDLMPLIIIIVVLVAASLYFLLPRSESEQERTTSPVNDPQPSTTESLDGSERETSRAIDEELSISSEPFKPLARADMSRSETSSSDSGDTKAERAAQTETETEVEINEELIEKADQIESFFHLLDQRDYIETFNLGEPSHVYFPELIQRLIDNPPIVTGETDDLFTILQNTAHFFRIIGKKNILILKGILDREKDTFEQTLADFYELTKHPLLLDQRFDLHITPESLYLYSGFFLNTMGGRLYLFRRDSMSRMVVSFYAIQILETANRQGRNKYGIDIQPAINNLINEIESSKIDLKLRDHYLDTLYDLKEKYQ